MRHEIRHGAKVAIALAVFFVAHESSILSARDIFVNNVAGNDLFRGDAPLPLHPGSGPFKTIERALADAHSTDRIVLAKTSEPYRECVTLQAGPHSGMPGRPFTIEGNGAVLDGSAPVPSESWSLYRGDLFYFRPQRVAHQQLFLDGLPLVRRGIARGGALPSLQEREWCLFDGGIVFRPEAGRHPSTYNLSYARHTVGLGLYEVRHVEVRDLVVQGYQLDGVNAHDSAFDVAFVNVQSLRNGRSGVSIGGASRAALTGCKLAENGVANLRTEGRSKTKLTDCELESGSPAPIDQTGGEIAGK